MSAVDVEKPRLIDIVIRTGAYIDLYPPEAKLDGDFNAEELRRIAGDSIG